MSNPIDQLERVMQPVGDARGLANAFYTDPTLFERERERIFADTWTCIGFAKDIPQPGDVRPNNMLGIPLLAVRDTHGSVRVYQNVCRHRGMILVDEPTNLKGVIRCPYHSWCYDLEGRLRVTPHVGGPGQNTDDSVDRSALGLIEVRSTVWMDLIFVNLSGRAEEFDARIAPLNDRWQEFIGKPLHHAGPDSSFSLTVNTNWKLAVENYCESYHLPWVHPGLNSYSRLEDHYNIVEMRDHSGQGTTVYNPQLDDTGRRFPDFADLSEKWNTAAEYIAIYPNVLFGVHRDHVFAILLEPVGPTKTIEHVEIYYTADTATGDDLADLREINARMWKEIFVVEGMQRGRAATGFDGGKFAPAMDAPTHCFHDWVASHMAGEPAPQQTAVAAE